MRSRTSLQWSSSESSNMWKMPFSNQGSFLWPWNLASSWFFYMLVCVYICVCMHALSVISVVLGGGGGSLGREPDVHFKNWETTVWGTDIYLGRGVLVEFTSQHRAVFVFDAEQHFLSTASLLLSDFMQYQYHFRHSDRLGYCQIYHLWKRIHHNLWLTYQKQSTYTNLLRAETVIGYPILFKECFLNLTDFQSRSWVLHQSKDMWLALSPKKEALGSEKFGLVSWGLAKPASDGEPAVVLERNSGLPSFLPFLLFPLPSDTPILMRGSVKTTLIL